MQKAQHVTDPGPEQAWPLDEVLTAVGEVGYVWRVASDRIEWSGGVHQILGLPHSVVLETATGFAEMFDADALSTRREAVFGSGKADDGEGVAFEVEYPLMRRARGGRVWVQDRGRWFAGPDGAHDTVVGVLRLLGARYESVEQAAMLARFDPLTGQLARARLIEVAAAALAAGARMQTASSFVLVSLVNLGPINETYGFDLGDLAIVEVSRRLRSAMRGGDTLGRFSTSTFGMSLQDCDRGDLEVVMRRLIAAVHDAPLVTPAGPIAIRVAIGGVVAPRHARDTAELVSRSRLALSRAASMPAAAHIYAPDPGREATRRANIRLADELISALKERRVRIALQPVVRADTGEKAWSEALVRVINADGAVISGGPLASAAEEVGLIHMLDRRALDLVVGYLAETPDARVAVNVSAATTADETWFEALNGWLMLRPDIAGRLLVEITETAAIADLEVTRSFVAALKERGVRVAIDDVGAGHTSFKALRQLSIELVKIDGSFVSDLETDPDSGAFVRALLALARELQFETVAEKVETQGVADMLKGWGVTYLQGELLASPELV